MYKRQVQLVIQAAAMGKGGEVFILDMGEPVRIVDLARDLIRLSGLDPDYDVEIAFTGIRPGEKIVEELLTVEEGTIATVHERIFVAKGEPLLDGNVRGFLDKCREFAEDNREGGKAFAVSYTHLDVYKRQPSRTSCPILSNRFAGYDGITNLRVDASLTDACRRIYSVIVFARYSTEYFLSLIHIYYRE